MEHRNNLALEVTKHIITICMAAIGLLVSGASTILSGTHSLNDFFYPIILFSIAILFSVLSQIALVGNSQGERLAYGFIKDEHFIIAAWIFFLSGISFSLFEIF
ncbi:hypothetical protein [Aeromonas hydrophila]|uniref:hypothetical protein n=1 Tax=Aeromonas hydrophila TaxID=644 RepID=UPI00191DD08F|nr:hypothetical protein [Aeromonas hydrophila]MBL0561409.1 hypothetical protein [Aeromonas hydrophila]